MILALLFITIIVSGICFIEHKRRMDIMQARIDTISSAYSPFYKLDCRLQILEDEYGVIRNRVSRLSVTQKEAPKKPAPKRKPAAKKSTAKGE